MKINRAVVSTELVINIIIVLSIFLQGFSSKDQKQKIALCIHYSVHGKLEYIDLHAFHLRIHCPSWGDLTCINKAVSCCNCNMHPLYETIIMYSTCTLSLAVCRASNNKLVSGLRQLFVTLSILIYNTE